MNTTNSEPAKTQLIEPKPTEIIALFGGTFDPIHLGHTSTAKQTAKWLGAKTVKIIPAHIPPHKPGTHASVKHREAMSLIACHSEPLFQLDNRELQRHTPSFTVESLIEIKHEHPAATLCFIMGMDSLLSFSRWVRWQEILTLCHLVVNLRPGYQYQILSTQLEAELHNRITTDISEINRQSSGKIILHHCQEVDISSTEIRKDIKAGNNYQQSVALDIYQYIEKHQLYR